MTATRTRSVPAIDRFVECITVLDNGCWQWTGFINPDGYGTIGYRGKRGVLAHRAIYEELVEPIPDGLTIDHRCHDITCQTDPCPHRSCVNPDHLEPTTNALNVQRGNNTQRTRCIHGHDYTPANTYRMGGKRYCIACWTKRHGYPPIKPENNRGAHR